MGAAVSINTKDELALLSVEELGNKVAELGEEYVVYKDGFISKNIDGKAISALSQDERIHTLKDIGIENDAHQNALIAEFEKIHLSSNAAADDSNTTTNGPSPIVFAGPSGAGKGTIIKALMDKYPNRFGFSVSHTTRGPRPGEEDGIHYSFVDKSVMEEAIEKKEFIEYANVHTNIYGTSIKAVENVRSQGKICILDIDIQGVKLVKNSGLTCKYIFISPPSVQDLEKRLRGRGTESEDKIQVRLANAIGEMEFGTAEGNFDVVVINDEVDRAVDEITQLLMQWYPEQFSSDYNNDSNNSAPAAAGSIKGSVKGSNGGAAAAEVVSTSKKEGSVKGSVKA